MFEGNSTAPEFQDVASKLTPLEFKVYLEKTFHLSLTSAEVSGVGWDIISFGQYLIPRNCALVYSPLWRLSTHEVLYLLFVCKFAFR